MSFYKVLNKQVYSIESYSIVPIRFEDRIAIMNWRNEQLYHLRQSKPLTIAEQDFYFSNIISKLFEQDQPNQVLFSFLENEVCIGYGGLVHINWTDKNAEISFIMNTSLETSRFQELWSIYLGLIEKIAFEELKLHKIYTYAFDIRPHLYEVLKSCKYKEEARLSNHCFFDGKFIDVLYHCKFNTNLTARKAVANDMMLYFDWTNDFVVRSNSYQTEPISLENHKNWFDSEINNSNSFLTVFENHIGDPVGQVRIKKIDDNIALLGISNDSNYRGKGYAARMIQMASDQFLKINPTIEISAYIKLENKASQKAFENAGYHLQTILDYNFTPSFHYIYKL